MKKVLVLGGTPDHRHLIGLLKKENYQVLLIDYLDNPPASDLADKHIQESTLDKELVLSIAKREGVDLVVAACIDQALLTMAYVAEELGLPCHVSYQSALELTDKTHMKRRMSRAGIPTSRYEIVQSTEAIEKSGFKFPLVVKPPDANGSKGVIKIADENQMAAAMAEVFALSRSGNAIIEEFVDGIEFSIDAVIENGNPNILLISENVKNENNTRNFTITQSFYSEENSKRLESEAASIARKIVEEYGIENGPLIIQAIDGPDGLSVVEFSSRIGGGSKHALIEAITGYDPVDAFLHLLMSRPYPVQPDRRYKYGVMNYIYTHDGYIGSINNLDEMEQERVIDRGFVYKTVGSGVDGSIYSRDRTAGYLIVDDDPQHLAKRVSQADESIRVIDQNGEDITLKITRKTHG